VKIPDIVASCTGIKVAGQILKTFVFSTDVAIIRNNNADGIIAVYPFAPQPLITQALILAAYKPIFVGIGGGSEKCERSIRLAEDAESQGAMGVVLNPNATNDLIRKLKNAITIPLVLTVVSVKDIFAERIEAGIDILNVSCAEKTSEMVRHIRSKNSIISIIATGGNTDETIQSVIESGASAISYTPPSTGELFREMMAHYRND
jgi:2-keto-3-deoxy-6-phosphogluconate aldolase